MRPAGRHRAATTSFKPFLQHVASGGPERTRTIDLKSGRKRPHVLTSGAADARPSPPTATTGDDSTRQGRPDKTALDTPLANYTSENLSDQAR
jgi:hypothetical protein